MIVTQKIDRKITWQDKDKGVYDEIWRRRVYILGIKVSDYSIGIEHHNVNEAPSGEGSKIGFK